MISNGLYFLVMGVWNLIQGEIGTYIHGIFNIGTLRDVILFNSSPFCEPLWYLNAILYCTIAVLLINKIGGRKYLYIIAPVLIFGDMILGKYSIFVFGRYFPNIWTRNWLFFGLPNVAIGMMIREYDIVGRIKKDTIFIKIVCAILITGLLFEYSVLERVGVHSERDHYICAALVSIMIFLLFAQIGTTHGFAKTVANIGRKASTIIYIIHPLFIMVLSLAFQKIGMERVFALTGPIIVFMFSTIFALLYEKIKHGKQ